MHYGSEDFDLKLHAFIDSEYIDAGPDGSRGGRSTFDNHHANFFITANLRKNLRAHTEFEFEHSGDPGPVSQWQRRPEDLVAGSQRADPRTFPRQGGVPAGGRRRAVQDNDTFLTQLVVDF